MILLKISIKTRRLAAPYIAPINESVKPFRASLFSEEAQAVAVTSVDLVTGVLITKTSMRKAVTGIIQGIESLFPNNRFSPSSLGSVPRYPQSVKPPPTHPPSASLLRMMSPGAPGPSRGSLTTTNESR